MEHRPGTNKVAVTVAQREPFNMTTTINATGGTLPAVVSSVMVPVGLTTSEEISVTPLEGRPSFWAWHNRLWLDFMQTQLLSDSVRMATPKLGVSVPTAFH